MKYSQDKFSEFYGSKDYRQAYDTVDWSDKIEEIDTISLDDGWTCVVYKDNGSDLFIVRCAGLRLQTSDVSRKKAVAAMAGAIKDGK